jgi:hypothetical protein
MISAKISYEYPFVNVALGKPATQSSLSVWSTEEGAGGLVNGNFEQNFGFHTDIEDAPWWRVDLLKSTPIEAVIVHNRLDMLQERARTLKIEISDDGETWTLLHAGICHFGGGTNGAPLIIPIGGKVWARHVRLSLTGRTQFHLSQLEIVADERKARLVQIREEHGLEIKFLGEEPGSYAQICYDVISASDDLSGPLIGLSYIENAPFGNGMIQYLHGIIIAKKLCLKYIRVGEKNRNELMKLDERIEIDGITFLPAVENLPVGGIFLSGFYFGWAPFVGRFGPISNVVGDEIIKGGVRKLFNVLPEVFSEKPQDQLLIHIRSGDIFANWINPEYVQPPLAFYKMVIERLVASGEVRTVKLVYENKLNPVIDPLETYLSDREIQFSVQSGTIAEDVEALVNGRYLIFGLGTFGPGICRFSDHVKAVFFFSQGADPGFHAISSVERAFEVVDSGGDYIKRGEWRNTDEQRMMMVEYPAEKLSFASSA